MTTILDEIIAGVRKDMATRQALLPLATLKVKIVKVAPPLAVIDWLRAIAVKRPAVIAEVKRKSPSKGSFGDIGDPAALARSYEAGGAAAISVLTEKRRFGGSLADLDAVRNAVSIPLLRKDFMVDEYQFYEARAHGADIVLLIVAALTEEKLSYFFELARSLGMAALVETHTEEEVDRAVGLGAELIGVNVRDLKTLAVDKEHFSPISGYIMKRTSDQEKKPVIVAESGIFSPNDVKKYWKAGAGAVLIGEALVKSRNPAAMIKQFTADGNLSDEQAVTSDDSREDAVKAAGTGEESQAEPESVEEFSLRDAPGPYFGDFGGRWMPEAMITVLDELDRAFTEAKADPEFKKQLDDLNENYSGRPSLLTEAKNFSRYAGGARIFLKREDLNHTGSHKINNVLGQALVAQRLGKRRLIAETGAGQHGVATATAAALFGMECTVYMGAQDIGRQALNVARMQLLGAEVVPVHQGSATLKDAINEALRDWIATTETTHYALGTVA